MEEACRELQWFDLGKSPGVEEEGEETSMMQGEGEHRPDWQGWNHLLGTGGAAAWRRSTSRYQSREQSKQAEPTGSPGHTHWAHVHPF